ncbi:MAG: MerC domain-containing protein [Dokdonella sp.]
MTEVRSAQNRSYADRFGATASFLCALHCALLPLIFAALPALGLSFLADHAFERAFVGFSVALAITSLIFGFRRHRRLVAFLFMVPGVLLLVAGVLFNVDHTNVSHAVMVSMGGVLVMCAHIANLRLAHVHTDSAACACPPALH